MAKLFIEDLDVKGKKVICRVDFNVPLKNGKVDSDVRLLGAIPTIKYLKEQGAKVILMSHLGRPKGKVNEDMRLAPVAARLGELLGSEVKMASDCVGPEVEASVNALTDGEVLVLENLRFYSEETDNGEDFAKQLASLADVYVNDAFGTAHRAHASTAGITKFIAQSASGYLLKKELEFLGDAIQTPKRPFVAIIGGSKISGKIDVIQSMLPKVDKLLIGGGMAFTFFKAMGYEIGNSLCEDDKVELAKEIIAKAGDKLVLPEDSQVTSGVDFGAMTCEALTNVDSAKIQPGTLGVDIGEAAVKTYTAIIKEAQTVLWNGPMGIFEIAETAVGTFEVAGSLAEATSKGAITIIGGGDSASAIGKAGLSDKVSHVSTGGGASLEFLEGKELPGVVALTDK